MATAKRTTTRKQVDHLERLHCALADKAEIEAEAMGEEMHAMRNSKDSARIYSFTTAVGRESSEYCMNTIGQWYREKPEKEIEIVFNSPGGSVIDGLALFDFIKELQNAGAVINTVSLGYAASMAGVLLQAGSKRTMGRHAFLLIHEISSGAIGNINKLEDEVKFCKRIQDQLLDILAERASLSKRQISSKWKRQDWWLDATEALELGFCDEIR